MTCEVAACVEWPSMWEFASAILDVLMALCGMGAVLFTFKRMVGSGE